MLGALIGAGTQLLGGLLGRDSAQKQADKNAALQREFAQSGIQWKVEDAKKAGVHPLYALGASTHSFSPVSISDPLPAAMANAGQDLSRAMTSTATPTQRQTAFGSAMESLTLEKAGLENQLLRSQIVRMNQTSSPPIPSAAQRWGVDGQGPTALPDTSGVSLPGTIIQDNPQKRVGFTGTPMEPGAISDLGYAKTAHGYFPVPSADVKERIEDQLIPELAWAIRNMGYPMLGAGQQPPYPAPKGHEWRFSPVYGYVLEKRYGTPPEVWLPKLKERFMRPWRGLF